MPLRGKAKDSSGREQRSRVIVPPATDRKKRPPHMTVKRRPSHSPCSHTQGLGVQCAGHAPPTVVQLERGRRRVAAKQRLITRFFAPAALFRTSILPRASRSASRLSIGPVSCLPLRACQSLGAWAA